uniref:Hexosyltransferase n=4 Tax=Wuchereria bancrofti TaxID=6293 RepID=A0AAF5PKV0_WUCBA
MFDYVNIIQTYYWSGCTRNTRNLFEAHLYARYLRIQSVAISMGRKYLDSFGTIFCHKESYIDTNTEVIQMLIKKASFKTLRRYGASTVCLLVIFLWILGWTDYIFEKSFSKFDWPPYINVREQVLLELTGQPSSYLYENDWAYFEPLHIPTCEISKAMNKFLLIIVKSSPLHFLKRQAIRVTWGSVFNHSDFTVKTIFVIGREPFNQENKRLQKEIDLYNDILVGDYIDSYRNNTLKFLSAVQFSFSYCHHHYTVPYALFVDDDYLVLVQNLVAEVKKYDMYDRLYMGWRFDTRPFRTRFHKHRVSVATYPFNRYPPYISAGAVLLSSQTIREMYYAIQHTKLYSYDDIYAGILAKSLKLTVKHNKNMRFWKAEVGVKEAKTLICAHGFEGKRLNSIYNKLRAEGIL